MATGYVHGTSARGIAHAIALGDGGAATAGDFAFVTYALGSCVGLTLWDEVAGVGGMLHSQLPVSSINTPRAGIEPFLFTDTGVAELLRRVFALGGDRSRVKACLAGCAQAVSAGSEFRVGQRNLAVARRVLWKNDIVVKAEDVGDDRPRTMFLDMRTGETTVRSDGTLKRL